MSMTRPSLAHLGIFATDLPAMEKFYTAVFGLVVTDRGVGGASGNELIFMSGSAEQHHQIVIAGGRAPDTPSTVMQLSFKVNSLDELRAVRDTALANGAKNLTTANHGNAWSIYFFDPEDNRIEIYLDTPFHTPQPCSHPFDLDQNDDALLQETRALIESLPGGMDRQDYVSSMKDVLG